MIEAVHSNIYLIASLMLLLGFIFGRLLKKVGLTEVLAYILAGILIGPVLKFNIPNWFNSVVTSITLSFVAYMVGLSFSYKFLRKMGKKVITILVVEVIITSLVVWAIVFIFTKNLPLSIILGSLAPATAPAGTIAVIRDLKAKGSLTDVSIAIVGLDDAAGIIIYSFGIVLTKSLLGGNVNIKAFVFRPLWEIFGAILLGITIGFIVSFITNRAKKLSSDHIFIITIGVVVLSWGIAQVIGVSAILTCMIFGMVMINFNNSISNRSNKLIDNIMSPIFILFFAAIGTQIDFSKFWGMIGLVLIYCIGRSIGKVLGCGLGGILSHSESKITKYLGIALLNQAGVAVGLAFLAAQELSAYPMGALIPTLMATTTAVFQILSPLGTQYALKKSGESTI
ncbi:MAG: cation:proton antiporter [Caldisericaceae bacterium]|nr:cation:proton antiporter [Caldisericaceae bacterium]